VNSKIHRVVSYLGPNQIAEGFYTFDGSTLRMVFANGEPVILEDEPMTETLPICSAEHVEAVAKKLTKRIRRAFRSEQVEGFGRVLEYEKESFA
jgi:hypothetical protein